MEDNHQKGPYRQGYVPSLKEGNPEKRRKKIDWWDELCKKHGAKNFCKKEKGDGKIL